MLRRVCKRLDSRLFQIGEPETMLRVDSPGINDCLRRHAGEG